MDAEFLECMPCVQPELPAAEEEDSREGADETVGDEEGREQLDVPGDPESTETPLLGGDQKGIICNNEQSVKPCKQWIPTIYSCFGKEHLWYAGYEIIIQESIENYGGVIWPAAKALCYFLEEKKDGFNLKDKKILEIGSGTGLVSIVACILGARVIATDLPDLLGNLRFNLSRNTKGRCLHIPEVRELIWGHDLQRNFPSTCVFDYIIAADVVYHHTCLDKLLETMRYFCQPGTQLIWANKFRFNTDFHFQSDFIGSFETEVLAEYPELEVKIFKATHKVD
ncbi:protein-lysine methyltransferase METTL21C [Hyla sarda]|uniref:protein-lysine methyltransferase METTL21C n=1 Tax=Hyla sarda TaxID=327740 RepID=UPI0024C2D224|nr:protein-lysine methyltransferase METTL21C [Hyla sarda]